MKWAAEQATPFFFLGYFVALPKCLPTEFHAKDPFVSNVIKA